MIIDNMKAEKLHGDRRTVSDTAFVETVIWRVPRPVVGSRHRYRNRLALIDDGRCVLRYDNEAGKGDHKHYGRRQVAYNFSDIERLQSDFNTEVEEWLARNQT